LRTPLTRLKLQLALMGDVDGLEDARKDLREMERMLDGYLTFARDGAEAQSTSVDLSGLVKECAENARRTKANIKIDVALGITISGRQDALGRCINNLIDNAMRYGDHVFVSLQKNASFADVIIEDDGPGIAEADYEDAFSPFNRLDPARNLNTDGVGLGLAIARDVARAHGGDILLGRSAHGGLRAVLHLPLADQDRDPS
jgi:two-component system osmolarity sensor histidine kinase EnvZ